MGGEIEHAVREVRAAGLLVVSLNMAGSVPDAADLVVTRSGTGRRDDGDGGGRDGEIFGGTANPPRLLARVRRWPIFGVRRRSAGT